MPTQTDWQELEHHQAVADADALAERIRALTNVLSGTTDAAQRKTLTAQLVEIHAEWEAAVTKRSRLAEGVPPPPKTEANGDIAELKRQVAALGTALASDKPDEAHAIISKAIDALGMIDARIVHVEARVSAIERHIHPPWIVTFWRVCAVLAIIAGLTAAALWRVVLFQLYLPIGIMIEGAFLGLAMVCVFQANAQMERAR